MAQYDHRKSDRILIRACGMTTVGIMSEDGIFDSINFCNSYIGLEPCPWYALRVRSKYEKVTHRALSDKRYETFLPLYRSLRRSSSSRVPSMLPLLPGYVFSRFDVKNILPILTTSGVVSIVGAGRVPTAIAESEIALLKQIVKSGAHVKSLPYVHEGKLVQIDAGPLKGITGIVKGSSKDFHVIVSIDMLQRSLCIKIEQELVSPMQDQFFPISGNYNRVNTVSL